MAQNITHERRAQYLKCVLYECRVLARSVLELQKVQDDSLAEVSKTAGVLKLRAVYDFLHRPAASDTIKRSMFDVYNPQVPPRMSKHWETWLTHQSINTYFVHLDRDRILKTVPQPKFNRGNQAVIRRAIKLLTEASDFARSIINHRDFVGLDTYGRKYWSEFQVTLADLGRETGIGGKRG